MPKKVQARAKLPPREVALHTEFIKLESLLKLAGVCMTGGEAKLRIQSGEVLVDGQVELRRGKKIVPGNVITVDGMRLLVVRGQPGE